MGYLGFSMARSVGSSGDEYVPDSAVGSPEQLATRYSGLPDSRFAVGGTKGSLGPSELPDPIIVPIKNDDAKAESFEHYQKVFVENTDTTKTLSNIRIRAGFNPSSRLIYIQELAEESWFVPRLRFSYDGEIYDAPGRINIAGDVEYFDLDVDETGIFLFTESALSGISSLDIGLADGVYVIIKNNQSVEGMNFDVVLEDAFVLTGASSTAPGSYVLDKDVLAVGATGVSGGNGYDINLGSWAGTSTVLSGADLSEQSVRSLDESQNISISTSLPSRRMSRFYVNYIGWKDKIENVRYERVIWVPSDGTETAVLFNPTYVRWFAGDSTIKLYLVKNRTFLGGVVDNVSFYSSMEREAFAEYLGGNGTIAHYVNNAQTPASHNIFADRGQGKDYYYLGVESRFEPFSFPEDGYGYESGDSPMRMLAWSKLAPEARVYIPSALGQPGYLYVTSTTPIRSFYFMMETNNTSTAEFRLFAEYFCSGQWKPVDVFDHTECLAIDGAVTLGDYQQWPARLVDAPPIAGGVRADFTYIPRANKLSYFVRIGVECLEDDAENHTFGAVVKNIYVASDYSPLAPFGHLYSLAEGDETDWVYQGDEPKNSDGTRKAWVPQDGSEENSLVFDELAPGEAKSFWLKILLRPDAMAMDDIELRFLAKYSV